MSRSPDNKSNKAPGISTYFSPLNESLGTLFTTDDPLQELVRLNEVEYVIPSNHGNHSHHTTHREIKEIEKNYSQLRENI